MLDATRVLLRCFDGERRDAAFNAGHIQVSKIHGTGFVFPK